MNNALPKSNLIATEKAIVAAAAAISLVKRVPAPLKSIADQVVRSASSVPANLSEGHGRSGRDRIHHWRIAYASAKEVDTHLRLLLPRCRHSSRTCRRRYSIASTKSEPSPGGCSTQDVDSPTRCCPWRAENPAPTGCRVRHCAGTAIRHRNAFRTMALPGSLGERDAVCCSGYEAGRRRAIGGVAALPVNLRATTPMVRRWAAGTPKRHSGPEGRC